MFFTEIIDLSHTICEGMPVYPGTEPPVIISANTIEKDGFAEKIITLYSHTGTHMDAPCHILSGAPGLDNLDISHFTGPGIVLDVSGNKSSNIDIDILKKYEPLIKGKSFVILKTGWEIFWGKEKYFSDFPVLTKDAAVWLSGLGLKGIGADMISIDETGSNDMLIHKTFLGKNMVIIENLANLDRLIGRNFIFCCFPLKMQQSDGSPVRAVAMLE